METKREPGIDLLRIVGMLFVVSVHQFLYNGFYSQPQTGFAMWAADCFRWLFVCCNGIFMMLSGYLHSEKPFTFKYYRGLVPLLMGYFLCCVVIFPLQSRLITEELSFSQWMEKLVGFGNYAWYLEMHIGLILISPVLNLGLGQIRDEKTLWGMAGIFFLLTGLPSLTAWNIALDYWTGLYPITYYVLGAAIRRTRPKVRVWQGLGAAALICMGLAGVSLLTAPKGFSSGYSQGYGGFWVTLIALCVFLGLYRVQPGEKTGRLLAWASGGCFEGYMLSLIPDLWAYGLVSQWHTPRKWPLVYLCVTIPIFLTSLLAGKLIHTLAGRITRCLPGFRVKRNGKSKT